MAEGQGYIGRSPGDSAVIIASQTFEPTGIQTNFTFASGYDPGYIDVYLNGCLLYTSPSPRDRTRSRMPSSA